ncbi:MAG: hypothetical protein ACYDDD_02285 [Acidithiobacillus ferrivorans]
MKTLVMLCLLAVAAPAMGTDWYVFNGNNHQCEKAAQAADDAGFPPYRTPYDYRLWARQHLNIYKGMGIHKMKDGLMIDFRIEHGRVIFTSTKRLCLIMASSIASVTHAPNLNELR